MNQSEEVVVKIPKQEGKEFCNARGVWGQFAPGAANRLGKGRDARRLSRFREKLSVNLPQKSDAHL